MKQHTIDKTVEFTGIGLHSGKNVHVVVHPAEENSGIRFRRVDLPNQPIISALIDNLHSKMRCTSLAKGDVHIFTTEHFLSTCMALQLDNLLIDIDYCCFFKMMFTSVVTSLTSTTPSPFTSPLRSSLEPVSIS